MANREITPCFSELSPSVPCCLWPFPSSERSVRAARRDFPLSHQELFASSPNLLAPPGAWCRAQGGSLAPVRPWAAWLLGVAGGQDAREPLRAGRTAPCPGLFPSPAPCAGAGSSPGMERLQSALCSQGDSSPCPLPIPAAAPRMGSHQNSSCWGCCVAPAELCCCWGSSP